MKALSLTIKIGAGVILIFLLLSWGGLYLYWYNNHQDKIYPGIKIGDILLGGTNKEQAKLILTTRTEKMKDLGLVFSYNTQEKTLEIIQTAFDAGAAYPVLDFDIDDMVDLTYKIEDERGFFAYLKHLLKLGRADNPGAIYNLNEKKIESWLQESFDFLNIEPVNAYFALEKEGGEEVLIRVPEKTGQIINYQKALEDLKNSLDLLKNDKIVLEVIPIKPKTTQADLVDSEEEIKKIIQSGNLTLFADAISGWQPPKKEWKVPPQIFTSWLQPGNSGNDESLALDVEKVEAYLQETIAPQVNQEPVLPRFEIKNNRISVWQIGKSGYVLDTLISAQKIADDFPYNKKSIPIVMNEISPTQLTAENDFKITEILGTGHSSFAGSPNNRRHNIRVGADALHGLLIKPEEEFSLLKALGEIDAAAGYLPELVIKGNRTVPEYGGGLCQIGTTVFRSALSTGLPITERRNHSYRVSYYEPAGTDATIYNPAPDFRFANDTGNYILIQARIEGDDLYFDFWGTSDGRVASTTDPVIYNIVKPPPTKIIETDELAPGERKCTERAHDGASAYFDYTVVYPDGATSTPVQTKRFHSRYVPWQAVCLVGKEKPKEPTENTQGNIPNEDPAPNNADSTPLSETINNEN